MAKRGRKSKAEKSAGRSRAEISASDLNGLVSEIDRAEQAKAEENETLRDIWATAKDKGINKPALKAAMRCRNMKPAEQNDFIADFGYYCDALGVGKQTEMFDEPLGMESNVVQLEHGEQIGPIPNTPPRAH